MRTQDLIEQLAEQLPARPWRWTRLRFGLSLLGAGLFALLLLTLFLGTPLAEVPRTGIAAFAMKTGFSLAVALAGASALFASGSPGSGMRVPLMVIGLAFLVMVVLALGEILAAEPAWPGASWKTCLTSIVLLTPLGFGGGVLAMRRLAPVRPRISGALAGLGAAATAATAYALWCPETNALFLLSWYAMPIALAGLAGALLGPRLLRW